MRYIFEKGQYPDHLEIDDKEFPDNEVAINHAKLIGADYVWNAPKDRNPDSVWRRGVDV